MRIVTLLALLALAGPLCLAQPSRTDFAARALAYTPDQGPGVADADFAKGRMILRETATATAGRDGAFNMSDFFNAFIAFGLLEEEDHARDAYALFRGFDGSCEYVTEILASRVGDGRYGALSPTIEQDVAACRSGEAEDFYTTPLAIGSDLELFNLMVRIDEDDQRHRTSPLAADWAERQRPLDEENLRLVDSLYAAHGTYVGRSLVGDQSATMWSVIQHSNPEAMQRYAPVIREAVEAGELQPGPYRMLVDRIYSLTEGYQIFGSQSSPLGTEAQIRAAKQRYGLE